jgi:hypothetical protein
MDKIKITLDAKDVLDCIGYSIETDFLLVALERFDRDNVTDALREYFGLRAERRESLPDFIDPTKL